MKRAQLHLLFLTLSLGLLALLLYQSIELRSQQATSNALQTIDAVTSDQISTLQEPSRDASPWLHLAYANKLSQSREFERAESTYTELIQSSEHPVVTGHAQFNLANAYLRLGMDAEAPGNLSRTMLALAKQRYRDLLKEQPDHWDARYNLEIALRLAPEGNGAVDSEPIEPVKRVRVIVPGFEKKDLP